MTSYANFMAESIGWLVLAPLALIALAFLWAKYEQRSDATASQPPIVPYYIPFIGSMLEFGIDPIKFIRKNQKFHGNYFTFLMFGRRMTVCVDIDGNDFVFNAKHSCVTAEDAYNPFTKPIFGEGVVYDVPNS
ncbi:Lanosterol 14-alpha-demethylase, partial [Coemansia sp. RSA 2424]